MIIPPNSLPPSDQEFGSPLYLDDETIQVLDEVEQTHFQQDLFSRLSSGAANETKVLSYTSARRADRQRENESKKDDSDSPPSDLPVASDNDDAPTVPNTPFKDPSQHPVRTPSPASYVVHGRTLRSKITPSKKATEEIRAAAARCQAPEPSNQPQDRKTSVNHLVNAYPEPSRMGPAQNVPVDVGQHNDVPASPLFPRDAVAGPSTAIDRGLHYFSDNIEYLQGYRTSPAPGPIRLLSPAMVPLEWEVGEAALSVAASSAVLNVGNAAQELQEHTAPDATTSRARVPFQDINADILDPVMTTEMAYLIEPLPNTGRPSDEVLAVLQEGFSDINKRIAKLAQDAGLPVETVLSRWNLQHGREMNPWNLYQRYFKQNMKVELERAGMVTPPGGAKDISVKTIAQCFILFKDAHPGGTWEEILKTSAQLEVLDRGERTTELQRRRAFRNAYTHLMKMVSP